MSETIDQQFTKMLMRKVETSLDFRPPEKEAEYGMPYYIVIPHSTFIKMGFDQADIGNILAKYKIFGAVSAYKKFDNIPGYDFTPSMDHFEMQAQDYFNKLHPEDSEWETIYVLEINKEKLDWMHDGLIDEDAHDTDRIIKYNAVSGAGVLRDKNFKFKNHQPEFKLFERLYAHKNRPIERSEILKILGIEESKNATLKINDLAKKIRTRTTLTLQELVLNNGDITLTI
jgi:hypothetical protein